MSRTAKIIIVALVVALVVLAWRWSGERSRAEDAEGRLGLEAGRVVTAVFTNARDLRVATLKGEAIARSTNDGTIFSTEQRIRAPYQVSYFVDLRQVGQDDLAWNPAERTMVVRIPDVTAEAAAIDLGRQQVTQKGIWVSRRAGVALQQRGNRYLSQAAAAKASSPEMKDRARAAAKEAVAAYVRQPLAAVGLDEVKVVVLFPWQGAPAGDRWDESRPVAEVLREAR